MSSYVLATIVGVLLSGVWIYSSRHYLNWEKEIFGYSLILAGVIYLLFGLIESVPPTSMITEALVGIGFIALAVVGLRGSLMALGIGWILHGIWDVSAPTIINTAYVPWFLEPTCLGFDFIVGIYLMLRARSMFALNGKTDARSTSVHNPNAGPN